eukprot:137755_1
MRVTMFFLYCLCISCFYYNTCLSCNYGQWMNKPLMISTNDCLTYTSSVMGSRKFICLNTTTIALGIYTTNNCSDSYTLDYSYKGQCNGNIAQQCDVKLMTFYDNNLCQGTSKWTSNVVINQCGYYGNAAYIMQCGQGEIWTTHYGGRTTCTGNPSQTHVIQPGYCSNVCGVKQGNTTTSPNTPTPNVNPSSMGTRLIVYPVIVFIVLFV